MAGGAEVKAHGVGAVVALEAGADNGEGLGAGGAGEERRGEERRGEERRGEERGCFPRMEGRDEAQQGSVTRVVERKQEKRV